MAGKEDKEEGRELEWGEGDLVVATTRSVWVLVVCGSHVTGINESSCFSISLCFMLQENLLETFPAHRKHCVLSRQLRNLSVIRMKV